MFLSPRFDAYSDASKQVMAVLHDVTPLVEPISLDEAFLDVAGARRSLGTGPEIGALLRSRIRARPGSPRRSAPRRRSCWPSWRATSPSPTACSSSKPGTELEFLHPLPVTRLWGVGPATRRRLERFGVETVGDLAQLPEPTLVRALGASAGAHLHALAWNRDDRAVEPDRVTKSIGHEETFAQDRTDLDGLERDALRMADAVASRLRGRRRPRAPCSSRCATATSGRSPGRTRCRRRPISRRDRRHRAQPAARGRPGDGIRLLGVSVQQLEEGVAVQGRLEFDDGTDPPTPERRALEDAVDSVRERFGNDAVGAAAFIDRGRLRTGRRASLWGPEDDVDRGDAAHDPDRLDDEEGNR